MAKGRSSKKVSQVNLKGFLDMDLMEITEQIKEDEYTYDLKKRLYEFNGKNVVITIKEEYAIPVKEDE